MELESLAKSTVPVKVAPDANVRLTSSVLSALAAGTAATVPAARATIASAFRYFNTWLLAFSAAIVVKPELDRRVSPGDFLFLFRGRTPRYAWFVWRTI
jgi:hypothetical protein